MLCTAHFYAQPFDMLFNVQHSIDWTHSVCVYHCKVWMFCCGKKMIKFPNWSSKQDLLEWIVFLLSQRSCITRRKKNTSKMKYKKNSTFRNVCGKESSAVDLNWKKRVANLRTYVQKSADNHEWWSSRRGFILIRIHPIHALRAHHSLTSSPGQFIQLSVYHHH